MSDGNGTNGDATKYTMTSVAEAAMLNERDGKAIASAMKRLLETMNVGDSLAIPGIGVFDKIRTKEREARNPKTGGTVTVPPKNRVKFRRSNNLSNL